MNDLIEQATLLMMTDRARERLIPDSLDPMPDIIVAATATPPIDDDTPLFI